MLNPVEVDILTSAWLPAHVAAIDATLLQEIPLVVASDLIDILPGFQLWDYWAFETPEGVAVSLEGWTPWVVMCAPRNVHPDLRHDVARLRLMLERSGIWSDCGFLLPDDLNPGSREWAGSTMFDARTGKVTLFYTVTGRSGDQLQTYEQRLFQVEGRLEQRDGNARVVDWTAPFENVVADDVHYVLVNQSEGRPGMIKGFRDPFHFRDPDGSDYLLFTGSLKRSSSEYNGVIGLARAVDEDLKNWKILPPLISADGVNNEMERPVVRHVHGLYYIFWSTQRKTFAPDGPSGPNGLYGMVSDALAGPYRPLNGTGLVAPNPATEPYQTYSWWVSDNLEVSGFVELWGLEGRDPSNDPDLVASQFGGVPAPRFRIALNGDRAHVIGL